MLARTLGAVLGGYPAGAVVLALVAGYAASVVLFLLLRGRLGETASLWAVVLFANGPLAEPMRTRALAYWRELEKRQTDQGGWAYYDSRPYSARPTWATSFCTALVLPSMIRARET